MKKLVALVSALCLGFVFTVGCGGTNTPPKKPGEKAPAAEKKTGDTKAPAAPEKKDEKK
jgi:hypothetical protein